MVKISPLLASHRIYVSKYLSDYPPEISEFTFTNIYMWRYSRLVQFSELEKSLVFLIGTAGNCREYILFGIPLGTLSLVKAVEIFGKSLIGAIRIPEHAAYLLKKAGFTIKTDRDNSDYVYRVRELAELKGRRYAKKRNQIKHCLQSFHCEYLPITRQIIPECMTMQKRWCQIRECVHDPGLCSENIAIAEMFARYEEYDLIGGAIRVDGEIQAYSVGERLNPATAVCHFEKALPGIPGLAQLINHWFAKFSLNAFEYINREQDLGIAGLRQAKESYYPHHLVKKYTVAFSDSFVPPKTSIDLCPG